jgi:SAM-dependent methyltransferase
VSINLTINNATLFNDKSDLYASARPLYPIELFEYISSLCQQHTHVWDCATGNGQAAIGLAKHFKQVEATDISQQQIANAFSHTNIHFSVQTAESTQFQDQQFDLVNVAQALHWFDFEQFWSEVYRVLKPGGLFVAYTYAWTTVTPQIDHVTDTYLKNIIEPYWAANNRLCWDGYRSVDFPFDQLDIPPFKMQMHWNLREYINFLHTWSATRRCIDDIGEAFFQQLQEALSTVWGPVDEVKNVSAPLTVIAGYINK